MRAALALLLLALPAPAHATASLSCEAEDKSLVFSAQASVSHGVGEAVTGFRGELRILLKTVPESLRTLTFEAGHLTQVWVRSRDVRLRIYRERPGEGPHGSVELVVETRGKGGGEPEFRGTYDLTVGYLAAPSDGEAKTVRARGRATCSVG